MSTLDGMLRMSEFYYADPDVPNGDENFVFRWTSCNVQCSDVLDINQLVCPGCRTPIHGVRRYGRPANAAALDVVERKFLQKCSREISRANEVLQAAESAAGESRAGLFKRMFGDGPAAPGAMRSARWLRNVLLRSGARLRGAEQFVKFAELHASASVLFRNVSVAAERPPTLNVYEAALSFVKHRLELARATADGRTANEGKPAELVKFIIRPPDNGFLVDGKLGVARANLSIFDEISRIMAVDQHKPTIGEQAHREGTESWRQAGLAVQRLAAAEAREAARIAGASAELRRQAEALFLLAQIRTRGLAVMLTDPSAESSRTELAKREGDEISALIEEAAAVGPKSVRQRFADVPGRLKKELLEVIEKGLSAPFYRAVTAGEKTDVVRAFAVELMGSGHWYKCPNGHVYVIGHCGMAMERSSCPECGAEVGGADHRSARGNELSEEFEGLLAESERRPPQEGAQRSLDAPVAVPDVPDVFNAVFNVPDVLNAALDAPDMPSVTHDAPDGRCLERSQLPARLKAALFPNITHKVPERTS
ncbi:MAG: hypothetical protein BJ554DRAFT_6110, partial [Olpidium bornovanus]